MLRSATCTAMGRFREAGVTRYDASSGPGQGDAAALKSGGKTGSARSCETVTSKRCIARKTRGQTPLSNDG